MHNTLGEKVVTNACKDQGPGKTQQQTSKRNNFAHLYLCELKHEAQSYLYVNTIRDEKSANGMRPLTVVPLWGLQMAVHPRDSVLKLLVSPAVTDLVIASPPTMIRCL